MADTKNSKKARKKRFRPKDFGLDQRGQMERLPSSFDVAVSRVSKLGKALPSSFDVAVSKLGKAAQPTGEMPSMDSVDDFILSIRSLTCMSRLQQAGGCRELALAKTAVTHRRPWCHPRYV